MRESQPSHRSVVTSLVLLCCLALAARLAYLLIAIDHMGLETLWNISPDTNTYWSVASHILGDDPRGEYCLFRVGPGYGLILAGIRTVFGSGPLAPLLFSVIMGALAPAAVYLLAFGIFRSRGIALAAGIIAALSHTSIALSCHILTDQPYFTLQCVALVCFVEGLRRGGWTWFVSAGLITGLAALVRPWGQLLPYLLVLTAFLLPVPRLIGYRRRLVARVAVAAGLALLLTVGWSARNYFVNDVFTFGSNGILTLRNCVVSQIEIGRNGKEIIRRRGWYAIEDGDLGPDLGAAYDKARERVVRAFWSHPDRLLEFYRHNLWENIKAPNYFPRGELPIAREHYELYVRPAKNWMNGALTILALLALAQLAFERRWSALLMLGFTFAYFTVLLGFSFWQGSRLHYPAEMAGAILLPYLIWRWFVVVRRWLVKMLGRRSAVPEGATEAEPDGAPEGQRF